MSIFRHSHDHEAVAVENREHRPVMLPATTSTVILWRCECGDVISTEIAGKWTLGQIRGDVVQRERIGADLLIAATQAP
jgi:hypothetical protein